MSLASIQAKLDKRRAAQITNKNNYYYGHQPLSPKTQPDMADYIDYTCSNKSWKNKQKRKGEKQYNNHI